MNAVGGSPRYETLGAGEGAGTSSMSSFEWILRKILPATSEYTRPELDAALAVIKNTIAFDASDEFNRSVDPSALEIPGADWAPIIEEEEMSNAVPYADSFVEEIMRVHVTDETLQQIDVITHVPILCEEYLANAGATKKSTCCVSILCKPVKGELGEDEQNKLKSRTDYESWSQRIRLYCMGKENGLKILQSIDQGPFKLRTTRDALGTTPEGGVLLGPERPHTYEDLSDTEKKRDDADVRATNIVLQGLPKDIYKLINHNIEAKVIWDNVKMLLAGSELTKEDRESQLYDEFERFKMLPGENINEYYVRFHKLVNDMRNIRMTIPNIQLNSKFVNNMSPEWDRFVTAVKLNKGLKETNHEQLYAYLKQHEKHANVQGRQNQNQNQRYLARGNNAAGNGGAQNRAGNAIACQGKSVKCYSCNGIEHIARNFLDEEELLFLAGEQVNTFDTDVDNQPVQDLALNKDKIFQADECDAFDS
ncbi:hypothetical protein Tco_0714925, partial [Tanacetum coccineum]